MEIERNDRDLAKKIILLEVQCKRLNEEKIKLEERVTEAKGSEEKTMGKYLKVKGKHGKVKEEFDSERRKWSEEVENIREGCRKLGLEKKKLEIELIAAKQRITDRNVEEAQKLWAKEKHCQSLLMESNVKTTTLLAENEALEKHIHQLERDLEAHMAMEAKKYKVVEEKMALEAKKHEVEEEKVFELTRKIQVLEREKGEMEATFCKMKEDSVNEAENFFNVNKAFESEKKSVEKAMKKINELVKMVAALERAKEAEKRAMEDEAKKNVSELTQRIEVLVRQKSEIKLAVEAEKRTLQAESRKKVLELDQRIEVLERELDTEVCRAKRERSEKIKKILNEKKVLEMEKQELEVETREKDERIKVLVQEKECLEGKGKEIETNWSVVKLHEDVVLPQRVHPARNVDILSTLTAQNQGSQSVDASHNEPKEDSNTTLQSTGSRVLRSDARRRKVEAAGCCSLANEAGTKRHKSDAKHELVWNGPEKLLNAFNTNDEVCMRAICTLYRKQKSMGRWKYCMLSSTTNKGFVQALQTRGMALGELLTSGDPEGGLKKSLAELEHADVEDCRVIAKYHYMELF